MTHQIGDIWTRHSAELVRVFVAVMVMFGSGGCVTSPRLTAEARKSDIEFLARWARDYHPCAEVNEKYKRTPSYEALLPKHLEFAEQAQTDEEFYLAAAMTSRSRGLPSTPRTEVAVC